MRYFEVFDGFFEAFKKALVMVPRDFPRILKNALDIAAELLQDVSGCPVHVLNVFQLRMQLRKGSTKILFCHGEKSPSLSIR